MANTHWDVVKLRLFLSKLRKEECQNYIERRQLLTEAKADPDYGVQFKLLISWGKC
jgi:hypothetical protein